MRFASCVGVVAVVARCLAGVSAFGAEDGPERHETSLLPGKSTVVEPFMLDRDEVHDIASGERRLSVRATPDGFLRFNVPAAVAEVSVTGTAGSRATFKLRPGDRVAVWPARRLEVSATPSGFSAEVDAADWAFVVRADMTSDDGVTVRCGGASCLLMAGWRLAMDRRGDEIVYRVVQRQWPGRVVGKPEKPARAKDDNESGKEAEAGPVGDAPERAPPLPFVERGWAAWEVRPAPPVSP